MIKLKDFKKIAVSVALSGTVLLSALPVLPFGGSDNNVAEAASVCTINDSKTYQTIRGFGGMNHPEWTGQDLTEAQRKTAFGNGDNELGLTVLRVFVNPDSTQWNKAVPTAKYASDNGVTVFASPWEPPANLAESGGSNGKLHIPKSNYGAYAQHLNNFGTYMKNNGVNLYSISVQNEPDFASEWTYWSTDETTDFIANYGDKITSTRLMSPESFQYAPENASWVSDGGKKFYKKILNNSKAMANCDLFGTHFYGTQRAWMDYPELENCGKEIWMTEVYVPNSDADSGNRYPEALQVSENIHNGLVVGNMSAYTWWYIRRSYGLMTEDGKISKRGYCMAQYSKYVRPGAKRIEATEQPSDDVLVSAYKNTDGSIVIVAINKGTEGYAQQFSTGENIKSINRYRTSQGENLALTENLANENGSFFAQLPGESVSTFVIQTDESGQQPTEAPTEAPSQPIQPDANGYYFHDTFEDSNDDWESRGAAELELSGRSPYKGTNALLAKNRSGSWNGAQKTLDSATFKAGQEFSFSACAAFLDGKTDACEFMLSLQYTDSSGETKYDHIASGAAAKGDYVQLANTNYKMPEGSDYILYVETAEGSDNFYIDEVIAAKPGTKIDGPQGIKVPETTIPGDITLDGKVNVFDLVAAKRGIAAGGFKNPYCAKAADVNKSTEFNKDDIQELFGFLMKKVREFTDQTPPEPEKPSYTMKEYTDMIAKQVIEIEPDSSHNEQAGVQYGTVKSGTYYSTTCKRNKPYNILLPAGYSSDKQYPVLYCMHGYWENQNRMIIEGNGTMYTRQIIGNAIAAGEAEDMIVVFPYIYSSETQDSCSAMDDANNAAYDNFINDLTVDLMPHIEKTYSVKTGRDNTAITGFSMGGRESLLIGMKRPDLFGYVGAICPAPGVTGAFKWNSDEEAPHLLFITAGSNDTVVYSNPENYHNNFTSNGVPHIWHYVNGGYHGDNSIHAHIYNFVRGIFKA